MTSKINTQLTREAAKTLQDLIQLNIDSRDGFRDAAEQIDDVTVAEFFRQVAEERNELANELQTIVATSGEQPEDEGSWTAAAHRAWMDLRSALGGGTAAVLSEAERGEDHIKERYEEALRDLAGNGSVNEVLMRQYSAVKAVHDRVRDLRDAMKD
jgi:uncharacterized protein (TIGR02284 family)